MRELIEVDWPSKRAVVEFYASREDTEDVVAKMIATCAEVARKADAIELYIINTGEGSPELARRLLSAVAASEFAGKVITKTAIGF